MQHVSAVVDIGQVFTPATKFPTLGDLVNVIVRNAFILAGVISFVLLIFAGFSVIVGAGSGDVKKLEQGKKAMAGAIGGLILVVLSVLIVQLIEKVTGYPLLGTP